MARGERIGILGFGERLQFLWCLKPSILVFIPQDARLYSEGSDYGTVWTSSIYRRSTR